MLDRIRSVLRDHGPRGAAAAVRSRVMPARAECFPQCAERLRGRRGLEIGGPSAIFAAGGALPVYPLVADLDNCNYAGTTIWDGDITEGRTYRFDAGRPPGHQYIAEASELAAIAADEYDFVLSSHTLEHTANPLRALREWSRVLEPSGVLVLIVPHRDGTFDHRRPITPLAHIVEDFEAGRGEDDLTHLPEVLSLHDFARDPKAGDATSFEARGRRNLEYRSLHHHVFDGALVMQVVDRAGLQIEAAEVLWPFHIICVARRLPAGSTPRNDGFTTAQARFLRRSPFRTDRRRHDDPRGAAR